MTASFYLQENNLNFNLSEKNSLQVEINCVVLESMTANIQVSGGIFCW